MLQLTRRIVGKNIEVYFDNFFTSPSLLYHLLKENILSCGTVRINRTGLPKDLKPDKQMKRGDIDRRSSQGLNFVKWMDTKAVHVISTIDSSMPVVTVKRRQKGLKEKLSVTCPLMIQNYNFGMKGTDLMDQKKRYMKAIEKTPANIIPRSSLILLIS